MVMILKSYSIYFAQFVLLPDLSKMCKNQCAVAVIVRSLFNLLVRYNNSILQLLTGHSALAVLGSYICQG